MMDAEMIERRKLEQMRCLYNDVLAERDAAIQRAAAAERQIELEREAMQDFHRAYNESITALSIKYREAVKRAEAAERNVWRWRELLERLVVELEQVQKTGVRFVVAHPQPTICAEGELRFRLGYNLEEVLSVCRAALDGSGGQRGE